MKEEFIELLRSTKRDGMEDLINFLEKSDFFKTMIDTLHNGGFDTQYVPGNSQFIIE